MIIIIIYNSDKYLRLVRRYEQYNSAETEDIIRHIIIYTEILYIN